MNLLLYMAPIAMCLLLPASLILEGNVLAKVIVKAKEDPMILLLLFTNASLAYLTNLTNFLVTKHTSALTLQVRPTWTCVFRTCGVLSCFHKEVSSEHTRTLMPAVRVGPVCIGFASWQNVHTVHASTVTRQLITAAAQYITELYHTALYCTLKRDECLDAAGRKPIDGDATCRCHAHACSGGHGAVSLLLCPSHAWRAT